ncbi:uncharacterized protein ACBT44_003541 isoform 1-T1 [Syngnathus typhle]
MSKQNGCNVTVSFRPASCGWRDVRRCPPFVWPKDLVSAAWSYKVLNLCNHQRADRAVSSKDAVGKSATYWPKESTLESRGDKSWSAKPATTTLRSFTWSHAA